jgi:hypothetical protein
MPFLVLLQNVKSINPLNMEKYTFNLLQNHSLKIHRQTGGIIELCGKNCSYGLIYQKKKGEVDKGDGGVKL